jgi:hypothetical protein
MRVGDAHCAASAATFERLGMAAASTATAALECLRMAATATAASGLLLAATVTAATLRLIGMTAAMATAVAATRLGCSRHRHRKRCNARCEDELPHHEFSLRFGRKRSSATAVPPAGAIGEASETVLNL